jgi:hypothetical protein
MDGLFDEDSTAGPAGVRDGKDSVTVAVAALATTLGVRVLRGGGTVFARHGLISPRVAPFTAFIVDPDGLPALAAALVAEGWRPRTAARPGQMLPPAISSFERGGSEGILNLHGVIPGFFADPAEVFEVMWQHREEVHLQGHPVVILDKPSTVLLAAHDRLGGQRWTRATPGHFDYFLSQFRGALSAADRDALLARARTLGAVCEIRPLIVGLGLDPGPSILPSLEYVGRRLALASPTVGDRWLITKLERPDGQAAPFPGMGEAVRSILRLRGARKRA